MAEKSILLRRFYDLDTKAFLREEWLDDVPENGDIPGDPYKLIEKANFAPVWELQSATIDPQIGNGILIGSYIIDKLRREVKVRYLLKFGTTTSHGIPSGAGTSRYYFMLPEQVPNADASVNEGSSVRGWMGSYEPSGAAVAYSVIDRAVAVSLDNVAWTPNNPQRMCNAHYIAVTIDYDY